MERKETKFDDVLLFVPDVHYDFRGENYMTWHEQLYREMGVSAHFPEHNIFSSCRGALSGIHYSPDCWKMYQCVHGKAYYAFIICDKDDEHFGEWQSFILSDRNHNQLIKPPKYGTGFLALEDNTKILVMQSEYYDPANPNQITFRYDDPRFNVWWPKLNQDPILSRRDEMGNYIDLTEVK